MQIERDSPERFLNGGLSWLDFHARVLTIAEDESVPLLERVQFLAIFASNLDEFFMVRVAGLRRQVAAGLAASVGGPSPREQLGDISKKSRDLSARHAALFCGRVMPALADRGIHILRWTELDEVQRRS